MSNVIVNIGHTASFTLVYLDQNGNPMLTTPVPDAPPAWSDTTPTTGTLTVAPDGLSAGELAVAVGTDVVNVAVLIGGNSFSASVGVTVQEAPQVLTSVQIAATVA